MELKIVWSELEKLDLKPLEYVFLFYLFSKIDYIDMFTEKSIDLVKLVDNKFIVVQKDIPILTNKGKKLFDALINSDLDTNCKKYQALFPNNVKSGGKVPIRSNINDIKEKFTRFFKIYDYTWEDILGATKLYLDDKKLDNWKYISTAAHFIIKQEHDMGKKSLLASYIDMYKVKDEECQIQKNKNEGNMKLA